MVVRVRKEGEGGTRRMAKGTGREERRERMNSDVFKYFKK